MRHLAYACLTTLLALVLFAAGCGDKRSEFKRLSTSSASSGQGGDGGGLQLTGGAGGDCVTEGVCGNEIHDIVFDAPNIYFILDKSGSMGALDGGKTRYSIVRDAAIDMINSLGTLINIGAAVFPHGNVQNEPCSAGAEVFPVTPGVPYDPDQETEVVTGFRVATGGSPFGGTPISASLAAIQQNLDDLGGTTIAILLTDGGPNCNAAATCDESTCMPHIEGECATGEDCCQAGHAVYGPLLCVDEPASVGEIQAIANLGIDVYVIGITGSAFYSGVLDNMAVAAGTDQSGAAYAVDDLDTLASLFGQIAGEAISCELPLNDPPEMPGFTNVYLGCDVVTYDPAQGWDWKDDTTVRLNGASCQKLKSGQVGQVTIATGCPTDVPK